MMGCHRALLSLAVVVVAARALVAPSGLRPRPALRATVQRAEGGEGWASRPSVPELEQARAVTPADERVPWDWRRFLTQSKEFVSLPSFAAPKAARVLRPGDSLGALDLFPLDDVVMGGASASTFDNERRRWSGEVTTRNSGGFVGVRSRTLSPPLDASRASGLSLTVRSGAALRYKVVLRDSTDFNGVAHTASFDVRGAPPRDVFGRPRDPAPQKIDVPFDSFVPTIFARTVPDAALDLAGIVAVQFALSKFEYDGGLSPLFREGPFDLEIVDIAVY